LRDYGVKEQIGLEPTLEEYISKLLQITNELKRVLKLTGVMFWNHGDSYCGSQGHFDAKNPKARKGKLISDWKGYSKKCLYLQNYRFILRIWILRNTIIWHKPNGMPSSVKDRFANKYEPVFMLVKNKKYWFDLDAVRVPHKESSYKRAKYNWKHSSRNEQATPPRTNRRWNVKELKYNFALGKNPGDVWIISTQPFPEAHFATFPEKLIEPMIKAGCPEDGIILDPFMGAGTTALVALKLNRSFIGIELNPEYIKMAEKRIEPYLKQGNLL